MIDKHLCPIQKSIRAFYPAACQCHEHQASGLGPSQFTPPLSDSTRVDTPFPLRRKSVYCTAPTFFYRPSSEPSLSPGLGSSPSLPSLEPITPTSVAADKGSEDASPFEVTDLYTSGSEEEGEDGVVDDTSEGGEVWELLSEAGVRRDSVRGKNTPAYLLGTLGTSGGR